jgi:hypothetical protein
MNLPARAKAANEAARIVLESMRESALDQIFEKPQRKAIKKWMAAQQDPAVSEIDAIRRLVELGLNAKK